MLRKAHATADVDELVDIGCDLADSGEADGAEYCFRRASDLGDAVAAFNLGNTLAGQKRLREAVDAYEVALERGETDAWLNLGMVLAELGDLAGEMRAYEHWPRRCWPAGGGTGASILPSSRPCVRERSCSPRPAQTSAACW